MEVGLGAEGRKEPWKPFPFNLTYLYIYSHTGHGEDEGWQGLTLLLQRKEMTVAEHPHPGHLFLPSSS